MDNSKYSNELKSEIVSKYKSGVPVSQLVEDYNLKSTYLIKQWVKQDNHTPFKDKKDLTVKQLSQINKDKKALEDIRKQLKRANQRSEKLDQEKEFLEKILDIIRSSKE